ncbi:MAG: PilZ domain-containing protein, partial [Pseudolabrys sp.]
MALAQVRQRPIPLAQERRRFQRVKVSLLGRYMLSDRREYPCQVINMSPGGIAMAAPVIGAPGERVIAYVDHLGRLEGLIVRMIDNGFAMTVSATPRKRDKLAAQLTWLANRHALNLPEDRRHERILPKNPRTTLTLANGMVYPCRVIDMSLSGAGVATDLRIEIGTAVMLGRMQSRVVRHFEGGI